MLAERPAIRVILDRRIVFVLEQVAMLQARRVGDVVVKPLVCLVDMLLLVKGQRSERVVLQCSLRPDSSDSPDW